MEEYLKVFLTDGEVPIDDSASEHALRNFTIGRENRVTINTIRGAQASAVIYSITETARVNDPNVYYDTRHLLTELPQFIDENGYIIDPFWSRSCCDWKHSPLLTVAGGGKFDVYHISDGNPVY